jgi:hypothetical protein
VPGLRAVVTEIEKSTFTIIHSDSLIARSRKSLAHSPIAGFTRTTDCLQIYAFALNLLICAMATKQDLGAAWHIRGVAWLSRVRCD